MELKKMEVANSYTQSSSAASSSYSAPSAKAENTAAAAVKAAKPDVQQSAAPQALQDALASLDLPELADGSARVELNFNQDTGRVIAKITDPVSGDVLRELPSKELQQLFSQMREYLGSFVDEEI